ncbi:hypothetical protein DFA_06833 [Cavenderia fasciculata]|uniref:Fibronectin type-III domain-containing protein n=1 Tax=Cavenderia fasciculata TaxID=261658 RepID=F4Q2E6_CACFS|nr:uncharacterized protein DFA_06833 [Cavenderia fasciculata]EGG18166.1 hypothetical protein DFA_06833 [Cavenderia fasciculata]|eukprot:XP_004366207.1 hypothetical protein DFA_06833 [Cavenderia fasciculata]
MDGYADSVPYSEKTNLIFSLYNFPSLEANVSAEYESVLIQWNSTGGVPGNITYQVSSIPSDTRNSPYVWCSGMNINSCLITGLVSQTNYSFEIQMSSVQFDPFVKIINTQTKQYPNNVTCVDYNNGNSQVDCNGHGECIDSTCLCDDSRTDLYLSASIEGELSRWL